ncbi:MAG: DUF1003 domain-containing protein [Candidatus Levybacteria bacterium]|nr:DUF1003 domain-containing protein [Candidatus Levybacteria bacterium]
MANTTNGASASHFADKLSRRRRLFKSFEAKALGSRTPIERMSDAITTSVGSMEFLMLNVYWFAIWIVLNIHVIPGVVPFDPFPFGLLTMIVSLEAIILSIFVLLSQNRAAHVDSLREELHLQVNLIAEEEITKALELLAEMREKMGIKREDAELAKMLERIDTSYIQSTLQKQIDTGTTNFLTMMNPLHVLSQNGATPPGKAVKEEKG